MSFEKRSEEARVDIIIPVFNACDFTRKCLESLFRNVSVPMRIWVIDNASTDATRAVLAELGAHCPRHIELFPVHNTENRGWIGGINQGLELSRAPFVVIANNDVLVYPHTMEEMISVAGADPRIGLVNPDSNEFGFRSDREGEPPSLSKIEELYLRNQGRWVEGCAVIGFFALIKRELIQKIGGMDPVYGHGYSEDDDYSECARAKGYLCVRALGAYVHHFGTKTFAHDAKKSLKEKNEKTLIARWGELRREVVLPGAKILKNRKNADVFSERLRERLRQKTGYIYIFVPRSKKHLFEFQHDNFWIKTYPARGLGTLSLFLWRLFRPKHKPVFVISPKNVMNE